MGINCEVCGSHYNSDWGHCPGCKVPGTMNREGLGLLTTAFIMPVVVAFLPIILVFMVLMMVIPSGDK